MEICLIHYLHMTIFHYSCFSFMSYFLFQHPFLLMVPPQLSISSQALPLSPKLKVDLDLHMVFHQILPSCTRLGRTDLLATFFYLYFLIMGIISSIPKSFKINHLLMDQEPFLDLFLKFQAPRQQQRLEPRFPQLERLRACSRVE